ncbi:Oidioi.mRNA.OKI2018_I69.chr1.g703.t1.cds [Oikopleura dioica]|uniref:Oidioi.mRNA.OKI2018_I69.chr1.g703.t1.cds n=1 Tax=Oikopleura dioica TaxID=34765 RepID=A0ABN7SQN8_OIKDI|nr:Oidioi.mRNA.OKI2018_I69.chr1.g703.t1.cds [Oikopleura dioica]
MALFTTNLNKPLLWDSMIKGETKSNIQRFIEPVAIDEKQFREIHEENMKNSDFKLYYSDMKETKERWEQARRESSQALETLKEWKKKLECFPLLKKSKESGSLLKGKDKDIYELREEGLADKIEEAKKLDDAKNKEKTKLREQWVHADRLWKEFSLTMLGQPFAYESDGKFFRIGGGTISLRQKPKKNLDEMGTEFREFLMDKKSVTTMSFAKITEILYKYEKACEPGTHDRGQVGEVLNFVRENPTCSRQDFLDEAMKIADADFKVELQRHIKSLRKNKEYENDLNNSIDPTTERDEILKQGRADFQVAKMMQRKLAPVREHLTEEERSR